MGCRRGAFCERALAALRHNAAAAIGLAILLGAVPAIMFGLMVLPILFGSSPSIPLPRTARMEGWLERRYARAGLRLRRCFAPGAHGFRANFHDV